MVSIFHPSYPHRPFELTSFGMHVHVYEYEVEIHMAQSEIIGITRHVVGSSVLENSISILIEDVIEHLFFHSSIFQDPIDGHCLPY